MTVRIIVAHYRRSVQPLDTSGVRALDGWRTVDNPGFSVKKIENKMALRVVQNGLITLKDCGVPERLQTAMCHSCTAMTFAVAVASKTSIAGHARQVTPSTTWFGSPFLFELQKVAPTNSEMKSRSLVKL